MTHIDTGIQAAKRQSWRHGPRDLLKHSVDKIGHDDRPALLRDFTELALDPANREALETMIGYWFDRNLLSLFPPPRRTQRTTRTNERIQRVDTIREEIVKRVKLAANQVLLDMKLPHGKKLRDSTGGECLAIGGWLGNVGRNMKPDELVGVVFTERQLRKVWDGSQ
jgi:hypothetical protein